ncbi:hypothetical protein [Streptomyces sp. ISL-86]|uniref:hypothetical protein n=1 Tax=unclassified Streptomyces TaxID=2593676 RepID=UPI0035A983D8
MLIVVALFTSLAGTALSDRPGLGGGTAFVLLALALLAARAAAGLLVRPLRAVCSSLTIRRLRDRT